MPDETLMLLIKDVRGKTLKLLDGLTDEQARWAPRGLQNSILWHAGHVVIVNEHLGVSAATGQPPSYPQDWFDKFSWKSKPDTVKQWPSLQEVKSTLQAQLDKLLSIVPSLSEQDLSRIPDPTRNRTLRHAIMHGMHDEANHQGEMWLLRKLWDKGRTAGA